MKRYAANLDVLNQPLQVTINGLPEYVVMSLKDYNQREQNLALLKVLIKSMDDQLNGRVKSSKELFESV